jgi:Raf kinase inhibitor-like YbhB/YbcL family protein
MPQPCYTINLEPTMTFKLISKAFDNGSDIPAAYTCDADNVSPDLSWFDLPAGTQSLALIVDDPDAPDPAAPKRIWTHWLLYNIPPTASGLPQGVKSDELPAGTHEGLNDWKETGYGGPCPPIGRHRYFHKLYALDVVLPDLGNPNRTALENAIRDHVLGQTELVGLYQRRR